MYWVDEQTAATGRCCVPFRQGSQGKKKTPSECATHILLILCVCRMKDTGTMAGTFHPVKRTAFNARNTTRRIGYRTSAAYPDPFRRANQAKPPKFEPKPPFLHVIQNSRNPHPPTCTAPPSALSLPDCSVQQQGSNNQPSVCRILQVCNLDREAGGDTHKTKCATSPIPSTEQKKKKSKRNRKCVRARCMYTHHPPRP